VLDLAKLLVDSLNEETISVSLAGKGEKEEKGIAKLERLLTQCQYPHVERDMTLLRTIQGVRSRGAAHRKASDYDLSRAGLDPADFHASFTVLKDLTAYANSRTR
jgi:Glu-tRNA(Gln) amidotransferase subunit E-like FAD-binding protein